MLNTTDNNNNSLAFQSTCRILSSQNFFAQNSKLCQSKFFMHLTGCFNLSLKVRTALECETLREIIAKDNKEKEKLEESQRILENKEKEMQVSAFNFKNK